MAYVLDPAASVPREVRRVARSRLGEAIEILEGLDGTAGENIEQAVHDVRKRCKEVRGLARLVRSSLGPEFDRFNAIVRDAAEALAPIRDAHAVLATLDDLRAVRNANGAADAAGATDLEQIRAVQLAEADEATRSVHGGDERIEEACELLMSARRRVKRWRMPDAFAPLGEGLEATYRRGRKTLELACEHPTDEHLHEWRKSVKNLWYHMRLLERAAPSVLEPIVATLDDLSEALGDDHDLAVLVERLACDPHHFGGGLHALKAIDVARAQQADLRRRAFRLGASVYAETPAAFTRRMESYWDRTVRDGPELATGGIAELAAEERHSVGTMAHDPAHTIERERKYLVAELPPLPDDGTELRQGYLALDGGVSVRLREMAGEACILTIKAGRGDTRTEVEWPVSGEQFAAMWEQTRGRRIRKTRYWLPLESHHVELDVFHDDLSGLVMAEVEFDSEASMAAFRPPSWFGREVTDDLAFTNASLAVNAPHGRPVSQFVRPGPHGAIA